MQKHGNIHTLITDYLQVLGVPYTEDYAISRVEAMPFKTLFGFSKLLEEYGVPSEGYFLSDKSEITKLTPPFIANTVAGFTIVTDIASDKVTYLSQGVEETVPLDEYQKVWDGNVLLSFPTQDAHEPDYTKHARIDFFQRAKRWVLLGAVILLLGYLFIVNGVWQHLSTILITAIDLGGIYFTYLLVQKSLNIHNAAADKVCGVLQTGGCDSILETKASKFFGLFGWSEVGFAYFSVSLLTLLLLPSMWPWLALCNLCCLPFTFWSIWYQRFRAHKWCTLCVCVQASLWLLFFCYFFGGWLKEALPLSLNFFALGLAYLSVMLGLNAIMPLIENKDKH
ncbi:MAG: vitamin K epoxide reductase family protein [Bacteroides sp.]|nr:vitamin K epoxide reductase family protein [Bacteroides sp.]